MRKTRWQTRRDSADPDESKMVQRFDRATLDGKPHLRSDGTMLFTARVAKPGVLVYRDALGGERRELVLPEHLHQKDSLATLGRATVTLEHPDDDVSPDNVGELGVGDVDGFVETEEAGGFVTVRLAVRRRDALDAISRGVREVSPGYKLPIDETPGTHPVYGRYDAIQGPRIYNHVAIVESARGGHDIRLRTDGAAYQIPLDDNRSQPKHKRADMNPLLIALLRSLGVSDISSEDAAITTAVGRIDSLRGFLGTALGTDDVRLDNIGALQKTLDKMKLDEQAAKDAATEEMKGKLKASEDALSEATGERDILKAAAEKAKADMKTKADAEERARLDSFCKSEDIRVDGADALDIPAYKKAIMTVAMPSLPEDASAAYIDGALRSTVQTRADAKGADPKNPWAVFGELGEAKRVDSSPSTEQKRRDDGEDAEDIPPSQIWQQNADAAFKAARGGK